MSLPSPLPLSVAINPPTPSADTQRVVDSVVKAVQSEQSTPPTGNISMTVFVYAVHRLFTPCPLPLHLLPQISYQIGVLGEWTHWDSKDMDRAFELFKGIAQSLFEGTKDADQPIAKPLELTLLFLEIQSKLTMHDLMVLLSKLGILKIVLPTPAVWSSVDSSIPEALLQVKTNNSSALDDLFLINDPEGSNRIGLNDYYLLLKDLFLTQDDFIFYLQGESPNTSMFESEGSYKLLMKALESLIFEDLCLDKAVYPRIRSVNFSRETFWPLLEALLESNRLHVNFSPTQTRQHLEHAISNFDLKYKNFMEKLDIAAVEGTPKKDKIIDVDRESVNKQLLARIEEDNKRQARSQEPSRYSRSNKDEDQDPLQTSGLDLLSEHHEIKPTEPDKPVKTSVLHTTKKTWKKGLLDIFSFYNKLQKHNKGTMTFEQFKQKRESMTLGEWVKFCSDFGLNPLAKFGAHTKPVRDNKPARQTLSEMFKLEAKGKAGIDYVAFEVILIINLESHLTALSQDTTGAGNP